MLPVPDGTASQVQSALDKAHAVNLADIDCAGGRMGREARGNRKPSPCYDMGCDGGVWRSCGLVGVGTHAPPRGERLWGCVGVCCCWGGDPQCL